MKTHKLILFLALIVVVLVQAACNFPGSEKPNPAATLNALYTQSAQTLEAMASRSALATPPVILLSRRPSPPPPSRRASTPPHPSRPSIPARLSPAVIGLISSPM